MERLLAIVKMGVYASIQDRGRTGYRKFGVPGSGPMDRLSHFYGNYILGNEADSPVLELFVGGFSFEALTDHTYVLTGAAADCTIDGEKVELWRKLELKKGQRLDVRAVTGGMVVYLSALGGFAGPYMLGSRSSYEPAGIGEPCRTGTVLRQLQPRENTRLRGLYAPYVPVFAKRKIRVYKGPHYELFDEASQTAFTAPFRFVGGNRMGYYLEGPRLSRKENSDILSEATQFGTVQVMPNGQPAVLMADSQTVGGYPIIATIIAYDLPYFVQRHLYDTVQFEMMEE